MIRCAAFLRTFRAFLVCIVLHSRRESHMVDTISRSFMQRRFHCFLLSIAVAFAGASSFAASHEGALTCGNCAAKSLNQTTGPSPIASEEQAGFSTAATSS